jgi:hypothetical protein
VTVDDELTDDEPPEHWSRINHPYSTTRTPRTSLRHELDLLQHGGGLTAAMAATVATRPATRRTKRAYGAVAIKVGGASRAGAHSDRVGRLGDDGDALERPVHGEAVTVALLPAVEKTAACGRLQMRRGAISGSRSCAHDWRSCRRGQFLRWSSSDGEFGRRMAVAGRGEKWRRKRKWVGR